MKPNEPYLSIMKQEETLMTGLEVQKVFQVSRTTLYRWVKTRKIKKIKIGGVNRYKWSDIEKIMK